MDLRRPSQTGASVPNAGSLSDDVATPESLVDAAYRLISFGPGGEPGWSSFRRLFADRSVLALRVFPEDPAVSVMTLDEYIGRQVREGMHEMGYEERPLDCVVAVTGDIAEARVRFQMVFGPQRVHDAVDVFQMVRCQGRWWIVSIISEIAGSRAEQRA